MSSRRTYQVHDCRDHLIIIGEVHKRAVRTASSEQVRQPIYDRSVSYWKNFETELQPLVDTLGRDTLARFTEL